MKSVRRDVRYRTLAVSRLAKLDAQKGTEMSRKLVLVLRDLLRGHGEHAGVQKMEHAKPAHQSPQGAFSNILLVLAVLKRRQSDAHPRFCGPRLAPEKERDRAEKQKVSDASASGSAERHSVAAGDIETMAAEVAP